jgi:hypothetical protein
MKGQQEPSPWWQWRQKISSVTQQETGGERQILYFDSLTHFLTEKATENLKQGKS